MNRRFDRLEASIGRIAATLIRLESTMNERMATKDVVAALESRVMQRMDAFSAQLEDSRFRWAVHADTLAAHDKRLKKLEAKKS